MKSIVLAEKPSVGRELALTLNCQPKGKSYYESTDYIVTWAMGHLVEPSDPEDYFEAWKKWDMETLPMLPEKMRLKVIKKTAFQFNAIKALLHRPDVNNLVIATDAGREGELVARWIMKLAGWKGSFQRLWISSQTKAAIKDGFANLKPGKNYDNLYYAAQSRSEADWLIGFNITRALCCKYDAKLSAGRVQTPTLGIIVNRENEIKSFKSEPFWSVECEMAGYKGVWSGNSGNNRFKNRTDAEFIAQKLTNQTGVITSINIEEKSEQPPLAYDLTALQSDANRIFGFSAKKTLQVLQGLYEHHKIATYPRTDSRCITTDIVPTLKARLQAFQNTKFSHTVKELLSKELNPGKRFVDNSKVSDHHAIIPTEERVVYDNLNIDEKNLWSLIAIRFLAVLSQDYRYRKICVNVNVNGESIVIKGIETVSAGWKAIQGADNTEKERDSDCVMKNLSILKKGDCVSINKVNIPQGQTQPPARYTEGTLLVAMENAGRFIKDEKLKASIAKGGIGTPATRADIIEKLVSNYYIERDGKELIPTPQGIELIEIVPEQLRSPELTAKWEIRLSNIAIGNEKGDEFISDIKNNAKYLVDQVKSDVRVYKPLNESSTICPMCGKRLLLVKGAKGEKILVCRSRSCGYEQKEEQNDGLRRNKTKKEIAFTQKMIHKYSDTDAKSTFTLADLMKIKEDNDKKNKNTK